MKHARIFLVLTLMLCFVGAAGMVLAEDVIKVGACQPITGRFAFAGKHIN
ncbi:MAG: branched-chain amino acid ABC transporter substrate-binding protein, partial [Deltaproteobacteria bacterium]|nr:branched-chain amino acid ABC transporter substrate-binding protein [Deltaproteobacteria bacterium]